MGGLTGAVHWWEESQLRVLVLTSLLIQFLLFFFPFLRAQALPGWFRFIMWLAYHGGDAVAIYALATLFNRYKDEGDGGVGGGGGGSSSNTLLEVVWAPVLLIHLGGHDGVTAYNIEDNELWSRHLLTAVSQVTVAIYVFCKSWPPGGDKRLLQAAILMFVVGVGKCFYKAWGFKRASIYNLASSAAAAKQINDGSMYNKLEKYVKDARDIVDGQQPKDNHRVDEEEDPGEHMLFIDLSSSYPRRIGIFKKFWDRRAYATVQAGLANAFLLLYTKLKALGPGETSKNSCAAKLSNIFMLLSRGYLPWASIALFHHSHREAYNGIDVKVTYAILCCTAVLEHFSSFTVVMAPKLNIFGWPETVAQYSLAGYFVRNKKHSIKMGIVSFFQCKDFVDQLWCMEPCFTSARITRKVLRYLEDGWKQKIQDAASYRSFNNHSSHWGLNMNRPFDECVLLWHLATDFCFFSSSSFPDHKCAFAEPTRKTPTPVLLWTRLIMVRGKRTSVAQNPASNTTNRPQCSQESAECKAVQCRQMSNYMVYLLFVNPEMLLPGTRRNLFTAAYNELKDILPEDSLFATAYKELKDILFIEDNKRNGYRRVAATFKEMKAILRDNKRNPLSWSQWKAAPVKEECLMERLISTMLNKAKQASEDELKEGRIQESKGGCHNQAKLIDDAWALARRLLDNNKGDEKKMWKEIERVWVEMLCFSASRCRGYLHAKALGKGGEFLSYVWLLLFHMGMETFTDKLQREQEPPSHDEAGSNDTAKLTREVSTTTGMEWLQREQEHLPSQGGNQYGTSSTSEICEVADDVV